MPSDVYPNSLDSPSPPDINPGNQPYPFMAGDSPTLFCNYPATTDSGNPTATLTLEGQTGITGQGEVNVTLAQLTSSDNGRTVVCTASNAFTVHNNTPVTQRLQLQVYCEYSFSFTQQLQIPVYCKYSFLFTRQLQLQVYCEYSSDNCRYLSTVSIRFYSPKNCRYMSTVSIRFHSPDNCRHRSAVSVRFYWHDRGSFISSGNISHWHNNVSYITPMRIRFSFIQQVHLQLGLL